MGKQGGKQKTGTGGASSGGVLREGNNGKKQSKAGFLKLQHLQNLAVWASGDAAVPSLGAFFGNRFAACAEVMGVPPDQSLFTCERCETILHPGDNCTVRIEKNKARKRHKHKGSKAPTQNNVVYKCHFCSHPTIKRGTLKGHMKQICPPKDKPTPKPRVQAAMRPKNTDTESCTTNSASTSTAIGNFAPEPCTRDSDNTFSAVEVATRENVDSTCISDTPHPVTPLVTTRRSLLDTKKRTRSKSGSKKEAEFNAARTDEPSTVSASKKRRKKTSTSLKDLVKSSESAKSRNLSDLTIPLFL
uniref:Uncharacterized protein n=1 Tax=Kalanchoe fedtschenkoi TaxID=63787 RepID=A0A7N1A912_KALFE